MEEFQQGGEEFAISGLDEYSHAGTPGYPGMAVREIVIGEFVATGHVCIVLQCVCRFRSLY